MNEMTYSILEEANDSECVLGVDWRIAKALLANCS